MFRIPGLRRFLGRATGRLAKERPRSTPRRLFATALEDRVLPAATIIDLGTLNGGLQSYASAINNSGEVVGQSDVEVDSATTQHAFLYHNGVMTDLGTLPGLAISAALSINDSGQVVGHSEAPDLSGERAVLFSGGTMTDLGLLPSFSISVATGINDLGQIVGLCNNADSLAHAALFGGATPTDLGTFGGEASEATCINDSEQIAGYVYSPPSAPKTFQAILYSGAKVVDLGSLAGPADYSAASAINDSGQVVGTSGTAKGEYHAFLYNADLSGSSMIDLGTLPGKLQSAAEGINHAWQVVGTAYATASYKDGHAFLYSAGVMTDLNSFLPANSGWTLTEATAINDKGQIVGEGYHNSNKNLHAFMLSLPSATPPPSPTPTPSPTPSPSATSAASHSPSPTPSPAASPGPNRRHQRGHTGPFGTRTVVTLSPRRSMWGHPVRLIALVESLSRNAGTPAGSISFIDGTITLGTVRLSHGKARLTISALSVGRNAIRAVYVGTPAFRASISTAAIETVRAGRPQGEGIRWRDLALIRKTSGMMSSPVAFGSGTRPSGVVGSTPLASTVLGTVPIPDGMALSDVGSPQGSNDSFEHRSGVLQHFIGPVVPVVRTAAGPGTCPRSPAWSGG